jgi:hypothetical protein
LASSKLSDEDKATMALAASQVMESSLLAASKVKEGSKLASAKAKESMQDEQNRETFDKGVELGRSQLFKLAKSVSDMTATMF